MRKRHLKKKKSSQNIPRHFRCFNSEIYDGETFLDGPVLPYNAWDACVVEFSPNVVFITGSFIDSQRAYLLDVDSGEVTELPPSPDTAKWFPACGVVDSPTYGGTDIVVAGGNDDPTVVIYNTELNAWRPGPTLPYAIEGVRNECKSTIYSITITISQANTLLFFRQSDYVPYEDSFILVGGRDDINNLNLVTNTRLPKVKPVYFWKNPEQKLHPLLDATNR